MIKHFILRHIDCDTLQDLIKVVEQMAGSDTLKIFIDSPGGEIGTCTAFISIFKSIRNLELHAMFKVYSCAMNLFILSPGKKVVYDSAIGMYHQTSCDLKILSSGQAAAGSNKKMLELMKSIDVDYERCFMNYIGMSVSEIDQFEAGEDVFFGPKDLVRFVEHSTANPALAPDYIVEAKIFMRDHGNDDLPF